MLAFAIAASTLLVVAAPAIAWNVTSFSGRAYGVSITTPITILTVADTGSLPPSGGEVDATAIMVSQPQVTANILLAVTMGFDEHAQSEAAIADVVLLPGSANQVTADFVRAQSVATCTGVSGESELVNLQVGGQQIQVSGQPNQVVTVPGVLTLVVNEQRSSSSGGTNSITVNALDLTLANGLGEVVVSSAHSDITCVSPPPTVPHDFVTGGGFIIVNGAHANFGFVAGFKPSATSPSGQLTYQDHGADLMVKATSVASYMGSGTSRTFSGSAEVDGVGGYTYSVTVTPGHAGQGTFSISLSNGYSASGTLAGGSIQLHT